MMTEERLMEIEALDRVAGDFPPSKGMYSQRRELLAEVKRLRAALKVEQERVWGPVGDNHHNAALCPYCTETRQ